MYATSKDGTRVPMFVVQKDGTPRDGTTPTVLYGYGGFNVNQSPAFSASALLTVERGGVWVTAILRGGGEFGEAWHRAGMLDKKQNTFDDAIACADKLIAERVTSPQHLAVRGASNGGLLVAAVVTQRPDLFRVGTSVVPLTDMLRYERFRIAKLWAPEYGSAGNPEQVEALFAYSPYHHVREGASYPSMLFSTAESDSRVDPMHARKMAARMQDAQGNADHPVLLRVESRAGHGQGKPVSKLVEQLADELSFLFHELGVAL
jgi:prolyl oligopeptidase